ncbi:MAG: hypothetical protein ACRC62_32785 [Microcoleus sp.]
MKLAQLESENTSLKNSLRQVVDTMKSAVKTEIQDAERRITDFLGDRLDDNSNQTKANHSEIVNLKVEFWGDKDRTVGLVNEVTDLTRKMQDFDRMHEEWVGVSGSEDRPGASSMLNRLWLDLRDRSTRLKTFSAIGAGGGLTFLVIAFNLISGAIEKASVANAERAAQNEARVTEARKMIFELDKTSSVTFAQIKKDIEFLTGKK